MTKKPVTKLTKQPRLSTEIVDFEAIRDRVGPSITIQASFPGLFHATNKKPILGIITQTAVIKNGDIIYDEYSIIPREAAKRDEMSEHDE